MNGVVVVLLSVGDRGKATASCRNCIFEFFVL